MGNEQTEKMKVECNCFGIVDKVVKAGTPSTSRVYLPVEWRGKKVRVLLLEPLEKD